MRRVCAVMATSLAVLAAVAPARATASSPLTPAAAVVDCNHSAFATNVVITSARNMTCRAAVRDIRRWRRPISRRFRTPGGFTCTRVSGGALGGQWRCVNGPRAYRFDFAD
jgi:hypothetical protein